jgi:hypothetical protein
LDLLLLVSREGNPSMTSQKGLLDEVPLGLPQWGYRQTCQQLLDTLLVGEWTAVVWPQAADSVVDKGLAPNLVRAVFSTKFYVRHHVGKPG